MKRIYLKRLREAKQFGIKKIYSCMGRHKSEVGSMLENIWIQIKEERKRGDITVGLHWRLPSQMGKIDKAFSIQITKLA